MMLQRQRSPGDYRANGFAVVRSVAPEPVRRGLIGMISSGFAAQGVANRFISKPDVNRRSSYEFHSSQFPPLLGFHWGLTAVASEIAQCRLAPSYAFFRAYQYGDILQVHSDRPSCDHSMSLALAYSDDVVWPIEIGADHFNYEEACRIKYASDFGDEQFSRVQLNPGDAIIYRGVNRRHGRMTPNPNSWSAHLFLHWVDLDGPFAEWAFDKRPPPPPGDLTLPSRSS